MSLTIHQPASILVTDDESNIRLMLRTALESEGYRVSEASDGRQALDVVHRQSPDLMMLDLSMPTLDGMRVLQELHRGTPDRMPRIIVLTAHGSIALAVQATRLGASDFLEKPVSLEQVREAVRSALAEPPPGLAKSPEEDPLAGGYQAVLDRIRHALRSDHGADAETLLMKAADLGQGDAAYFNLLGILYEVRREWRLARKFYGKAVASDKRYEPAQSNLRRLYELHAFGRSQIPIALGTEEAAEAARPLGAANR